MIVGLTIDSPTDKDWYHFRLAATPQAGHAVTLTSLSSDDRVTFDVYRVKVDAQGQPVLDPQGNLQYEVATKDSDHDGRLDFVRPVNATDFWASGLTGLTANKDYWLHIETDRVPTVYQLDFNFGDAAEGAASNDAVNLATDLGNFDAVGRVPDLRLSTSGDVDYYQFALGRGGDAADMLELDVLQSTGPVRIDLIQRTDTGDALLQSALSSGVASPALLRLNGVAAGT